MLGLIFCFNHSAPTEIYPLSLHDALPISSARRRSSRRRPPAAPAQRSQSPRHVGSASPWLRRLAISWLPAGKDRKSTRLNSSHLGISYAVFCLKKKKYEEKDSQGGKGRAV